ncbi:MAG: rod shape-determining protein MreC [Planctomycetaceae bacterium]
MGYRGAHRRLWTWLLCGIGGVLLVAPSTWTDLLRGTLRDLLSPGLRGVQTVQEFARSQSEAWNSTIARWSSQSTNPVEQEKLERLAAEVRAWQAVARREQLLQLEWQRRHDELKRYGPAPGVLDVGLPLMGLELKECRVLGEESATLWRKRRLIQGGSQQGLEESVLVLEDVRPLIDQGGDAGLEIGLPIFAGRCVVGRLAKVGNWTSTVQSITDRDFRGGLAQLCRQSESGPAWGAVGKIEGMGDEKKLCRLTAVPATEAVSIGDRVYTAVEDGVLPGGLYYGEVVHAELTPGSLHWDIHVSPAANLENLQRVQVLMRMENSQRPLGN